jgi:hypothetical protein
MRPVPARLLAVKRSRPPLPGWGHLRAPDWLFRRSVVASSLVALGACAWAEPALAQPRPRPKAPPTTSSKAPSDAATKEDTALLVATLEVMLGDRPKGELASARKKLEAALAKHKKAGAAVRIGAIRLLAVVLAEDGKDKDAAKRFAELLKLDADADLGDYDSKLRTPAAERAYDEARAKAKLPPKPRPEPPPPPDRAVIAAAEAPIAPVAGAGGGTFTQGLGLVAGPLPTTVPRTPKTSLTVPSTRPAVTTHVNFALSLGYVLLKPTIDTGPAAGGSPGGEQPTPGLTETTGPRIDFALYVNPRFEGATWFRPGVGVELGLARPSQATKAYLLPEGDERFWLAATRAKAKLGLGLGPLSLTPYAGVFYDYYAPADTVPGDDKSAAALSGVLYGGSAGLHAGGWSARIGYTFEKGPDQTARKRRLELGLPGGTDIFWEAREVVSGSFDLAGKNGKYSDILAASMPVAHHYGVTFQW